MTAEINELFEEGITRSRELSDAADETMDAIDEMAKEAEELAQRVEDEATEARQHLRDLAAASSSAEGALEPSRARPRARSRASPARPPSLRRRRSSCSTGSRRAWPSSSRATRRWRRRSRRTWRPRRRSSRSWPAGRRKRRPKAEEELQKVAQAIARLAHGHRHGARRVRAEAAGVGRRRRDAGDRGGSEHARPGRAVCPTCSARQATALVAGREHHGGPAQRGHGRAEEALRRAGPAGPGHARCSRWRPRWATLRRGGRDAGQELTRARPSARAPGPRHRPCRPWTPLTGGARRRRGPGVSHGHSRRQASSTCSASSGLLATATGAAQQVDDHVNEAAAASPSSRTTRSDEGGGLNDELTELGHALETEEAEAALGDPS